MELPAPQGEGQGVGSLIFHFQLITPSAFYYRPHPTLRAPLPLRGGECHAESFLSPLPLGGLGWAPLLGWGGLLFNAPEPPRRT